MAFPFGKTIFPIPGNGPLPCFLEGGHVFGAGFRPTSLQHVDGSRRPVSRFAPPGRSPPDGLSGQGVLPQKNVKQLPTLPATTPRSGLLSDPRKPSRQGLLGFRRSKRALGPALGGEEMAQRERCEAPSNSLVFVEKVYSWIVVDPNDLIAGYLYKYFK